MMHIDRKWQRRLGALVFAALAGLTVAACGVKSSPKQPDGATYPRQYPRPLPALPEYSDTQDQRRPASRQSTYGQPTYGQPTYGQSRQGTEPGGPTGSIYQYPNPPSYIPPKQ